MATAANAIPQGLDISTLLGAAQEFSKSNDTATAGLQSDYSKAQQAEDSNAMLAKAMGDNSVIVENAKNTAALETQANRVKIATALGTNMKDGSEILTSLSQTIAQQYQARESALQRIEQKRNISLFDDPLGWINAQFTINDDINAHNIADERLNNAEAYYADANKLTQTAAATQNAIDEPITAAAVKASADNTLAAASIKANDETIKGLIYNSDGIKAALQGANNRFSAVQAGFSAQKAEENNRIALAHLALSREEFSWRKEEKDKGKQADEFLLEQINKGRKLRMGDSADLLLPGTVRANTALSLLKSNSPAGKQMQEDYQIAQDSDVAGTKILAPSAARAIEILNTMPVKLSPAQEGVKDLLSQAKDQVVGAIQAGQIDPKNTAAVNQALNMAARNLVETQAKKVSDPTNIFNIPKVSTLIQQSSVVADLPITQKLLAPLAKAGSDLSDPNQVFGVVATALQDKKITYPEALELSTIYQTGVGVNMEARQLSSLGLTPKWQYNVPITTNPASPFGGKEVVDMTKPDQIGRALNKYLSRNINPLSALPYGQVPPPEAPGISPQERTNAMFPPGKLPPAIGQQ